MNSETRAETMGWRGLTILVLLFLTAFIYLFTLRFESGDFLPAYSSLRRDPMGTAVLFEALAESGLQVQRNHEDLALAQLKPNDTLFIIGLKGGTTGFLGGKVVRQKITDFIQGGGRLIITYSPIFLRNKTKKDTDETPSKQEVTDVSETPAPDAGKEEPPPIWAVSTEQLPASDTTNSRILATGAVSGKELSMVWPHTMVFTDVDPEWKILLSIQKEPVLMEKVLGAGSVVLATSSHFLSNEAMLRGPQLPLLTWLVGTPGRILFDEYHHGLRSSRSVTGLIRSYNLHGVIVLIFLLAALFLWKNCSSLLPHIAQDSDTLHPVSGRDQFEAMVGLLKRHPLKNLLLTAFEQWKGGNCDWCQNHPSQLTEINALTSQTEKKLSEEEEVARYRAISRLLHPENQPYSSHHE